MAGKQANIDVVKKYFDSFLTHDADKTLAVVTDDIRWEVQGAPNVPTVGKFHGKEEVRKWLEIFTKNFKPLNIQFDKYFENGDDVVTLGSFTHLALPTNKEVSSEFAAHLVVRGDKIAVYRFFEDSYALYAAFPH
jgi:ketosteroid isomerase-like protein